MQPHLTLIASRLHANEFLKACAHDILTVARALKSFKPFLHVHNVFRYLSPVSGLTLKHNKIHVLLLSSRPALQPERTVRTCVLQYIPDAAIAHIAYYIKFLGFYIGAHVARMK